MSNRHQRKVERINEARKERYKNVFLIAGLGIIIVSAFFAIYGCGEFGYEKVADDPSIEDGFVCALNSTGNAQTDGVYINVVGDACTSREDGDEVCSRRALTFVDFVGGCFQFRDAAQDGVDVQWGGDCFLQGMRSGTNINDTINADLQPNPNVLCHIAENFQVYETCNQYVRDRFESYSFEELAKLSANLARCCADFATRSNQPPTDDTCERDDALGF